MAGLSFSLYGVRVGIRVNCADAFELLLSRLPPGRKASCNSMVNRLFSEIIGGAAGAGRGISRFNLLYPSL